jgi:hypothetical protein
MVPGSFVSMRIMHCCSAKWYTVFRWMFATCWESTVVAMTEIVMMIDVPIEVFRPVIPRTRPDKYTAREPLRTIVSIRSTVIRRNFVISIRAYRRRPDTHRYLCRRIGS